MARVPAYAHSRVPSKWSQKGDLKAAIIGAAVPATVGADEEQLISSTSTACWLQPTRTWAIGRLRTNGGPLRTTEVSPTTNDSVFGATPHHPRRKTRWAHLGTQTSNPSHGGRFGWPYHLSHLSEVGAEDSNFESRGWAQSVISDPPPLCPMAYAWPRGPNPCAESMCHSEGIFGFLTRLGYEYQIYSDTPASRRLTRTWPYSSTPSRLRAV